jgi:AcrR family transcriptional regulator
MNSPRKRLTAAERKPQILRSAIRAMAQSNYRTTSIAEIASAAGITEPAVYRYFPTKKALFIAIIEDVGNRMLEIWENHLNTAPSPVEALHRISIDYYERAMTRRGDLKVLFQALAEVDDEDIRSALRIEFQGYVKLLVSLFDRSVKTEVMHPDFDREAAAWSFLSVGFTLNLVGLLGLDRELDKGRLLKIQDLFLTSLLREGDEGRKTAARKRPAP